MIRNLAKLSFGGSYMVNRANGRIGFLRNALKASYYSLQCRLAREGKVIGKFGEVEGQVHGAFAFSSLQYNERRKAYKFGVSFVRVTRANSQRKALTESRSVRRSLGRRPPDS